MMKDITKQWWEMLCYQRWHPLCHKSRVPSMGCLCIVHNVPPTAHVLLQTLSPVSRYLFKYLCQWNPPSYLWFCIQHRCMVSTCSSKPHWIITNQCLVFSKHWLDVYQNAAMYDNRCTPALPFLPSPMLAPWGEPGPSPRYSSAAPSGLPPLPIQSCCLLLFRQCL